MTNISRREMIAGLMVGTALMATGPSSQAAAMSGAAEPEYMFTPGLNYLNTAALGPTPRSILEKTLAAWYEVETDPVMTSYGTGSVAVKTDAAKEQLASLIGCTADELLITRSTTVAMNSLAAGITFKRGDRVLTTDVEHEGGSVCWTSLERRGAISIDRISIAPGDFDTAGILRRLEKAISKRTRVISVSHIVTSTGLKMPVEDISAMARKRGILFVVDGAQAVGGIAVNVKEIGCHAYTAPGHKWLMAPKGTGFLYVSKDADAEIKPVEWQGSRRFVSDSSGVGSLPLMVGLGAAAEAMKSRGMTAVESRVVELRNRAYAGLIKMPRITVVSPPPGPLATGLVSFKLPDTIDSRVFRDALLNKYGIVIKVGEKRWFNGNRISPHIFNTEAEIDAALSAIRTELA